METMRDGHFVWHELAATDPAAAARFYAAVVGWAVEPVPALSYTVFKAGEARVAGATTLPEHVRAAGVQPHWTGYIQAADVDAKAREVEAGGGRLRYGPDDIPGVGRFAVMTDPDGAAFNLFAAIDPGPEAAPMSPGHVGWNELIARDGAAASAFYRGLFGWEETRAFAMGPAGTYQIYGYGGQDRGGMMSAPPGVPAHWCFYFVVDALDAARARLEAAGGRVTREPAEVPGGAWVLAAADPEGAAFALVAPKR